MSKTKKELISALFFRLKYLNIYSYYNNFTYELFWEKTRKIQVTNRYCIHYIDDNGITLKPIKYQNISQYLHWQYCNQRIMRYEIIDNNTKNTRKNTIDDITKIFMSSMTYIFKSQPLINQKDVEKSAVFGVRFIENIKQT